MADAKKFNIEWDVSGTKFFEAGVDHGVLYPMSQEAATKGTYPKGVAWNGLITISESPEGGDENAFYADNIKYGTLRGTEDFGGSIEAYTYPDEWEACDGSLTLAKGAVVSQQVRRPFGLSYRTWIGSDDSALGDNYKIHLVYGATASPSEKSRETVNDSPDAASMSWDFTTTPVNVGDGFKPTSHIIVDSRNASAAGLAALEQALYGTPAEGQTAAVDGHLPLPDEVITLLGTT